jgi:Protein of unknown function (DUF3631)
MVHAYAVADAAGSHWPDKVRNATTALAVTEDDAETIGVKPLADIRDAFNASFDEQVQARVAEPKTWLASLRADRKAGRNGGPPLGRIRQIRQANHPKPTGAAAETVRNRSRQR